MSIFFILGVYALHTPHGLRLVVVADVRHSLRRDEEERERGRERGREREEREERGGKKW
jgi:hypothetical protein